MVNSPYCIIRSGSTVAVNLGTVSAIDFLRRLALSLDRLIVARYHYRLLLNRWKTIRYIQAACISSSVITISSPWALFRLSNHN